MDTWDKTHEAEKSQGWCPAVIDSNGDGKIGPGWTEPDQPLDPAKDRRVEFGCYAIAYSEKDHGHPEQQICWAHSQREDW